jgi:hypothetical protein
VSLLSHQSVFVLLALCLSFPICFGNDDFVVPPNTSILPLIPSLPFLVLCGNVTLPALSAGQKAGVDSHRVLGESSVSSNEKLVLCGQLAASRLPRQRVLRHNWKYVGGKWLGSQRLCGEFHTRGPGEH